MQNKQYKHTNLLLYCSKKFYKFKQVSNNETEQRNFTHLIRCQNVKPYVYIYTLILLLSIGIQILEIPICQKNSHVS
jgi:hypothetical protein